MRLLQSTATAFLAALAACGGATSPASGTDASTCRSGSTCDASTCSGCQSDTGSAVSDSGPTSQCDACEADGSAPDAQSDACDQGGSRGTDAHFDANPTDPCGAVGPDDCSACAGPCANGRCVITLASGQNGGPVAIAVDTTSVYWATYAPGAVMRAPIHCGAVETLVSGIIGAAIAVDRTSVYWTDTYSVVKAALDGSSPVTLLSGLVGPGAIAVDTTSVYVGCSGILNVSGSYDNGTVVKVALDGGAPSTLASGIHNPGGQAIDTASVYFDQGQFGGTAVMKAPLGGGAAVPLVANPENVVGGLTVDSTSVYWADYGDGLVLRVGLDGGTPGTVASGQLNPDQVAIDTTSLYWTNNTGSPKGSVVKVALKPGCVPVTLASGLGSPLAIAVDGTSVYWTNYDDGTVMRTSK